MMEHGQNEFQIVNECLNGSRTVDSAAMESAAVLNERLERLKRASVLFKQISPSPEFAALSKTKHAAVVC